MGLSEVAVLPQQIFEQLFAGLQHALRRARENMMYAGWLSECHAKCRAFNPKLGDYVCRVLSSFALSAARLTRNSGTMRIYL